MGPFVSSKSGEQYILSIIDSFIKYLILVPLKDNTASTVSKALYERVVGYFGCPRKLLSDRGKEFTGRIWTDLMDILGVQQVLTSPYYPQGNGIVERSHRTIRNLLRAHLSSEDDDNWVDLLPGVMLTFNKMTQDYHGFTASQILWGQSMNLPVDLVHGEPAKGSGDTGGYVKYLQKRLQEIRRTVAPFNRQQEKAKENPFKVGELVLIFQQPMERDHKLSTKWRGPFPIVKIENPFQLCYDDRGREKIAHVRHCKKFKTATTSGKEKYVIFSNDVTSSDSWTLQGGRSDDVEEACDLLTPNEGRPIGSTMPIFKNRRKGVGILSAILCPTVVGRCCSRILKSASRGLPLLSRIFHLLQHGCSQSKDLLRS